MSKFNFQNEQNLGGVVQRDVKVFCEWSPAKDITNAKQVTRDVCGHMFSKLCGFAFKSTLQQLYRAPNQERTWNVDFPDFMIVYCPKTRNNFTRNDKGLSGWYIWQNVSKTEKIVFSIHDLYAYYGFDISKFFQSDLFERYLPLFKQQVLSAYQQKVVPYVNGLPIDGADGYTARDIKFYSRCVYDSVAVINGKSRIEDVLMAPLETPDEKKAKLAYNADKTYALRPSAKNLKLTDEAVNHGFPDYQFNNLGDFNSFNMMLQYEYDLTDRENVVFRDKNGREMKIVDWSVLNNGVNFTLDY